MTFTFTLIKSLVKYSALFQNVFNFRLDLTNNEALYVSVVLAESFDLFTLIDHSPSQSDTFFHVELYRFHVRIFVENHGLDTIFTKTSCKKCI